MFHIKVFTMPCIIFLFITVINSPYKLFAFQNGPDIQKDLSGQSISEHIETGEEISSDEKNKKFSLLYFYSEGCNFCQEQKPVIKELEKEYGEEITVVYIDIYENMQLSDQYNINTVPEIFLVGTGSKQDLIYLQFTGLTSKKTLSEAVAKIITKNTAASNEKIPADKLTVESPSYCKTPQGSPIGSNITVGGINYYFVGNDHVIMSVGINDQYADWGRLYKDGAFVQQYVPGSHKYTSTNLAIGQTITYMLEVWRDPAEHSEEGNPYILATCSMPVTVGKIKGTIDESVTWDDDTYSIFNTVFVVDNATLTISSTPFVIKDPDADDAVIGTTTGPFIRVQNNASLIVNGASIDNVPLDLNDLASLVIDGANISSSTIHLWDEAEGSVKIENSNLINTGIDGGPITPRLLDEVLINNNTFVNFWLADMRIAANTVFYNNQGSCDGVFEFYAGSDENISLHVNNNQMSNCDLTVDAIWGMPGNTSVVIEINTFGSINVIPYEQSSPKKIEIKNNELIRGTGGVGLGRIYVRNIGSELLLEGNTCEHISFLNVGVLSEPLPVENHSVKNNVVSSHIKLEKSYYVLVNDNEVSCINSGEGIQLKNSSYNEIVDNTVSGCNNGLKMWGTSGLVSRENLIKGNRIFSNTVYGIDIGSETESNLTYDNYFNNLNNVKDVGFRNFWNIEKTIGTNILHGNFIGGNFWSDYEGEDEDDDGIGDTPYIIDEDNYISDDLPLVYNLVVNVTDDEEDADPNDGVCDVDLQTEGNQCTFRAAIQCANALGENRTIKFDIPGETLPTIHLQSPLPPILYPVLIDGNSQTGNGKVQIDGTNAGIGAQGLYILTGGCTVRGLVIQNFMGNGITFNIQGDFKRNGITFPKEQSNNLNLIDAEIIDNIGWGISSSGDIFVNNVEETITSITNINNCKRGGIFSYNGRVSARSLEVANNDGPGILAQYNVNLIDVTVNNNKGPGVQSFNGGIEINRLNDESQPTQIIGNKGMGIAAYGLIDADAAHCELNINCESVVIRNAVEIKDNNGWGIYAESGDILVNVGPSPSSPQVVTTSLISNNGKGDECWVIDDRDQTPVPGVFGVLGGIFSYNGQVTAYLVEVKDNWGPGILAQENVNLIDIVSNNNMGPGIQSFNGGIEIRRLNNESQPVQVIGNKGMGIAAYGLLDADAAHCELNIICDGVMIKTACEVNDNNGWGVYSRAGTININVGPNPSSPEVNEFSFVNNNGKGDNCWVISHRDAALEQGALGVLGGVFSYGGQVKANLIEVNDNYGPGILGEGNVYLIDVVSNNNTGPGIESLTGGVEIRRLNDESHRIQVRGNKGIGIAAYGLLDPDNANYESHTNCESVIIRTSCWISNNEGFGIYADNGDILVNVSLNQLSPQIFETSSINHNGRGDECWIIENRDDNYLDRWYGRFGGIKCNYWGSIIGHLLYVSYNSSDGVKTIWDSVILYLCKVNYNQGYGIVTSFADLLSVELSNNEFSGILFTTSPDYIPPAKLEHNDNNDPGKNYVEYTKDNSTISGSTITQNTIDGIRFNGRNSLNITKNNITDNGGYGINNLNPNVEIIAQENWWGDTDGPGGTGTGSGDEISGNVDFSNWRINQISLVSFVEKDSLYISPGNTDSVYVFYQNYLKLDDIIDISITDDYGWVNEPISYSSGMNDSLGTTTYVKINVPPGVNEGLADKVIIYAQSQSDANVFQTDSFYVYVYRPQLKVISISPDSSTVMVGDSLQLSVAGYDQQGNSIETIPSWQANLGEINQNGLYKATTPGVALITATDITSGTQATASVIVTELTAQLDFIKVEPDSVVLYPAESQLFIAKGYNQFGFPHSTKVEWSATGGIINLVGLFIADSTDGAFTISARDTTTGITGTATVVIETVVSVEDEKIIPTEFKLYQNYPNPFNPVTKIKFTIPAVETAHELSLQQQFVTLIVYNLLGQEVATLVDEPKQPGVYEVYFNASNLASGIYFYQLRAGEVNFVKKMILIR